MLIFLLVTAGRCNWYLVGRGRGHPAVLRAAPLPAPTPTCPKSDLAPSGNSVEVDKYCMKPTFIWCLICIMYCVSFNGDGLRVK